MNERIPDRCSIGYSDVRSGYVARGRILSCNVESTSNIEGILSSESSV